MIIQQLDIVVPRQQLFKNGEIKNRLLVRRYKKIMPKTITFHNQHPYVNDLKRQTTTISDVLEMNTNGEDSFHKSIGPILAIAQVCGLMPVCGITNVDATSLHFKWRSFRIIITVIILLSGGTFAILLLRTVSKAGLSAKNIGKYKKNTNLIITTSINFLLTFFHFSWCCIF